MKVVNEYDVLSESQPLHDGDNNLAVVYSDTPHPFSYDLFLAPATYDFFYTPHFAPQLTLRLANSSVSDQMLGGCLSCNYTYIDLSANKGYQITDCALASDNKRVTITGTSLTNATSVVWAGNPCTMLS